MLKLKYLILGIILCLFIACAPKPFLLSLEREGPPLFSQGYREGCESGLAAFGNSYYKTFYSFKKTPEAIGDPVYEDGWGQGYGYCKTYVLRWSHAPFQ